MKNIVSCGTVKEGELLDQNYWNEKWLNQKIGWDIGFVSPAIASYFKKIADKNIRILIPGCGNAYEAEFLLEEGFTDISIIDISPKACDILNKKFKNNKEIKIFSEDFFQHEGNYDFIIEQTFFCAIPTINRNQYAKKTAELLAENGKIIGLLFNRNFEQKGPPFGGSSAEYQFIFKKYFEIIKMEESVKSISERQGMELFINLQKLT
ncbi:methyltransferase domain-containing protein [Halpernia sp.]|uniref:methyltransferase domain-containing protein n=1 Tax=Halpernia sp. TaxID=2782209 RepID=UPI003A8D1BF9